MQFIAVKNCAVSLMTGTIEIISENSRAGQCAKCEILQVNTGINFVIRYRHEYRLVSAPQYRRLSLIYVITFAAGTSARARLPILVLFFPFFLFFFSSPFALIPSASDRTTGRPHRSQKAIDSGRPTLTAAALLSCIC